MIRANRILPVLAAALALGACDDAGTSSTGGEPARLSLLLTDAPGDFRAAVVTITDVYLQPAEGEDAERVYLRRGDALTTDLLTLQNRVQSLVGDQPVPAGTYEQLRLVITGGYLEVEQADGSSAIYASSPDYAGLPAGARVTGELKMPGFASSGLKVLLNGGQGGVDFDEEGEPEDDGALTLSGDQTLILDFDVAQSFGKPAGRSGKWVMRPVIKATRVESAAALTVSLSLADGVALPPLVGEALSLGGFGITLTPVAGGDVKTAAPADEDGDGVWEASFLYLPAGEYRVGLAAPAGITVGTAPALPLAVTVGPGAEAEAALTLTSVVAAQ